MFRLNIGSNFRFGREERNDSALGIQHTHGLSFERFMFLLSALNAYYEINATRRFITIQSFV